MKYKKVAKASGLTVGELAVLLGVSRVTASNWINERSSPHTLHAARVAEIWKRIAQAVIDRDLPLDIKTRQRGEPRLAALKELLPELF